MKKKTVFVITRGRVFNHNTRRTPGEDLGLNQKGWEGLMNLCFIFGTYLPYFLKMLKEKAFPVIVTGVGARFEQTLEGVCLRSANVTQDLVWGTRDFELPSRWQIEKALHRLPDRALVICDPQVVDMMKKPKRGDEARPATMFVVKVGAKRQRVQPRFYAHGSHLI